MGSEPQAKSGSDIWAVSKITTNSHDQPSCKKVKWSASNATIHPGEGCKRKVTLGKEGTAVLKAEFTDQNGSVATAARQVKVTAPPALPDPKFSAMKATAGGVTLGYPGEVDSQVPVTFSVSYLNYPQAKVKPKYAWSYSVQGRAEQPLSGGSSTIEKSTRVFESTEMWGETLNFKVTITDSKTGKLLVSRTYKVKWRSQ